MNRNIVLSSLFFLASVFVVGCSPAGPKLVQISGTVTFKGKPVPAGYITFTPPSGGGVVRGVQIKDGKFNTADIVGAEKGVHPGENKIIIAGFDGVVIKFYGQGKQIFNPWEDKFDVPGTTSTKDFVVPESAAKNLKIEPTSDD